MKMLATACWVLGGGMLFSTAAQGPSASAPRPKFKIEIGAPVEKGREPKFAVTNLTAKTVTACVFEQSYASESARKATIVWDALVQGNTPIEPGQTVLRPVSPNIQNALPNKVEVIAGIWADGESFGPPTNGPAISSRTGLCEPPSMKMRPRYCSGDWTRIGTAVSTNKRLPRSPILARSIPFAPH